MGKRHRPSRPSRASRGPVYSQPLMPPGMEAPANAGPAPSPRITLEFETHDEYVAWIALHRSTGQDMAAQRFRSALIQGIQSLTSEEAIAVGGYLRSAVMSGWEGAPLQEAHLALGFVCGLNAMPGTEEVPQAAPAGLAVAQGLQPPAPAAAPPPAPPPPSAGPAPVPGGPRA